MISVSCLLWREGKKEEGGQMLAQIFGWLTRDCLRVSRHD